MILPIMLIHIGLTLVGFVLLFGGGDWLVSGATGLAKRFGISELLVSLIVVGFGTSLPELLVCVEAALSGAPGIALGNVAGSNLANTFLILGVASVIYPMMCDNPGVRRDSLAVIGASVFLIAAKFLGVINLWLGACMLGVLISYLFWCYLSELMRNKEAKNSKSTSSTTSVLEDIDIPESAMKAGILVTIGLITLAVGAKALVTGSTYIAREFGVSEAVIGLSLVALGTSLPELATAVVASMKKQSDIIIGNVLGSNLFNILAILGTTALVSPLPIVGRIAQIDIWFVLFSAVLLYPVMVTGKKIDRREGALFLVIYLGYIGSMFFTG